MDRHTPFMPFMDLTDKEKDTLSISTYAPNVFYLMEFTDGTYDGTIDQYHIDNKCTSHYVYDYLPRRFENCD